MKKYFYLSIIVLFAFSSCKKVKYDYSPVDKMSTNDPYSSTMTGSQFFEINADQDNVIEGEQGIIITIPKGSLFSQGEKTVTGTVKVELTEALNLSDMIFSNLTTTSNGELLSTGGMFYINFTQNNEQLVINKKIPVYVQVPRNSDKEMLLYKGTRDSLGNMNWSNPQKQKKYLIPVPLNTLNFTPIIFDQTLNDNLPFGGVAVPTRKFTDSVYYSIEKMYGWMSTYVPVFNGSEMLEPDGKKIEFKYLDYTVPRDVHESTEDKSNCGINPLSIKALKESKFEGTFIATKEFEIRIQAIHKTCRQDVLDVYVNNIDKDLSVIDAMAADLLKGTPDELTFRSFSEEGLGNVEDAANSKYAKVLSEFYQRRTEKFEKEIEGIQNRVKESLVKKDKEYIKELNKYQEIIRKREKHRMEYFGYELTETGWFNVDTGTVPKDWFEKQIDVTVNNSEKFDMLNVYVWMPSNESLLRLIPQGNNLFRSESMRDNPTIPLEKNKMFHIIAVGKVGEKYFFTQEGWIPTQEDLISTKILLVETPKGEIDLIMNNQAKGVKEENEIKTDLKFQQYFYERETVFNNYLNELEKVTALYNSVCKCCQPVGEKQVMGERLFKQNCSRCHYPTGYQKMVGSSMVPVLYTKSYEYFRDFTRNSQSLIQSGNKEAIAIFNEYNQSVMPSFNLSDLEIQSIYDYLKAKNNCEGTNLTSTDTLKVK